MTVHSIDRRKLPGDPLPFPTGEFHDPAETVVVFDRSGLPDGFPFVLDDAGRADGASLPMSLQACALTTRLEAQPIWCCGTECTTVCADARHRHSAGFQKTEDTPFLTFRWVPSSSASPPWVLASACSFRSDWLSEEHGRWYVGDMTERERFRVDVAIPLGAKPNWLTGAGATRSELALVYASAIAGAALVWWFFQRSEPWAVWQVAVAVVITADLFGGAVANALSSTKRQYQAPLAASPNPWVHVVRNPVWFTALHAYPLIAVALYPGGSWWWGIGWYAATLGSAILVACIVPGYLQRPTAMAIFVIAIPIALEFPGPPGWSWLPPVLLAKLLLAHAVHEEAYRP